MKKVKYIITAFILAFCLILSSEMFQNHLNTFNNNLYYFEVNLYNNNEKKQLLDLIKKTVKDNNAEVFCINKNTPSKSNLDITIYSSKQPSDFLKKKYIKTGSFNSLFSGTTNIEISDFNNLVNSPNTNTYYLSCNMEVARNIRNTINSQYASSYIHKTNNYSLEWILPAIYILCGLFILVLSWLDIQFQKKENFILISLGKSRLKIIIKNILLDIIVNLSIIFLTYFGLNKIIYLQYLKQLALLVLIAFFLTNSLLYLSMISFDFKQVLYGANIKQSILSNAFVLKSAIMFLTIILLSSNIILITENSNFIHQYKTIKENFSSYHFLKLHNNAGSEEEFLKITNEIFINNYKKKRVGFSVINYEDNSNSTYVMLDKNSSILIHDILKDTKISEDADFTILYPEKCVDIETVISNSVSSFYSVFEEGFESAKYNVVPYKGNRYVTYFDSSNDTTLESGFDNVKNPVIILCNVSNTLFPKNITAYTCALSHISNDVMYVLNEQDINIINSKLVKSYGQINYNNPNFYVSSENVAERCEKNISAFARIVLLNTVVSILMLVLNLAIIITIIKMEFKIEAMEIALKKIMGYSLLKRNRTLLLLNLLTIFIGIFSVFIVCIILKISNWYIILFTGGFLIAFEYLIILYYVVKVEKANISKTLKGGSL